MTAIDEIRAPLRDTPRYLPDRRFPAYRFVPGLTPHPRRDPTGHSFGIDEAPPPDHWRPKQWRDIGDWLYGVDLFNHFFFWEAHEAWEGLWRSSARDAPQRLLLQGLIQIAAALLKIRQQSCPSAARLERAGIEKLKQAADSSPVCMGLDVAAAITDMETYFRPLASSVLPEWDASVPTLRLGQARSTPGDVQA